MSLLNESVEQVTLTADTAPERPHLPLPEALRDDLRLADRGYFDREYLGAVDRAGGYFVMRASASVNPKVQGAYTWEGEALEGWSGQLLKQGVRSKGETVDLDVVWGEGEKALELRLLARWNRDEGCHTVVGDESAARPIQCGAGGAALPVAVAGRAVVQGVEVVCESLRLTRAKRG